VSANVDLVRSICTAWERGDYSSAAWADAEIEFVRADGPLPGRWTGPQGMVEATREWLHTWEDARAEADDYRELDPERVLVLTRYAGRGKASGLDIGSLGAKGAQLFQIRDGRVVRCVHYLSRDQAFADLGIAPEAGSG
jgi:ketosteroid isomerase-like protein